MPTLPRSRTVRVLALVVSFAPLASARPQLAEVDPVLATAHDAAPPTPEVRDLAELHGCGTSLTAESAALQLERAAARAVGHGLPPDLEHALFHIPIAMHVIRRSNGTGGLGANAVLNTLRDVNLLFAPVGMHFCQVGETIFIDDDQFFDCVCDGETDILRTVARVDGSVNAYFVPTLTSGGLALCGLGTLPGTANSGIILRNSCTAEGNNLSTVAHELGHFMDLLHTHETFYGVECPSGSNCESAGDLVCDTPADPNLLGRVTPSCEYTGPAFGNCPGGGGPLDPPLDNIMSYSRSACRSLFSRGQVERMRETLFFERPELARLECLDEEVPPNRTLLRISENADGEQADGASRSPAVASKGRFVAFVSNATNLVPGIDGGLDQIYLYDLELGTLEHVSRTRTGAAADSFCGSPALSHDGRYVVYSSSASNLVPEVPGPMSAGFKGNVYRLDRETGETTLVSRAPDGGGTNQLELNRCAVSDDGRLVVFTSSATNLIPIEGFTFPRIYLADVELGTLELASVNDAGVPANSVSADPTISGDGRIIAFSSFSTNLGGGFDFFSDVFVHDRFAHTTRKVILEHDGVNAFGNAYSPSLSRDGRYVALEVIANGPWEDDRTTDVGDVAVKDRVTGDLLRASESRDGIPTARGSDAPALSAHGRFVAFRSEANEFTGPGGPHADQDVWLKDLQTGSIQQVSLNGTDSFGAALDKIAIDARGTVVAFASEAINLVPDDTNGVADVFVKVLGRR